MKNESFGKNERLHSRKAITEVVSSGSSFLKYPIRCSHKFMELHTKAPTQFLVGVSKKRFKRAVDRNRIKRLMRECIRKNKEALYPSLEGQDLKLAIMLIYIGNEMPNYQALEAKIILTLHRLAEVISSQNQD
jgi:ribonuclease P protein component